MLRVRFLFTVVFSSGLFSSLAPAQDAPELREHPAGFSRGFHGTLGVRRSFGSDAEARAVFKRILAATGFAGMDDRIIIRSSADIDFAEAQLTPDNERLIFYNVVRLQELKTQTKEYWSMVAVLAHELGHHLKLHTVISGRNHEFEIEADHYAGFALRRMGASLEQAQSAFRNIGTEEATPTHPARRERLNAVTRGWLDADYQAPLAPKTPVETPRVQSTTKGFKDCERCPEMIRLPAGRITIGSTEAEEEKPPHTVTIARPFAMGRFEVTFNEWQACSNGGGCRSNPTPADQGWGRGSRPVINVSWTDATEFVTWLSGATGQSYRLPSEGEWEFAARAGSTTRYSFGDAFSASFARFSQEGWGSAGQSLEVGAFPPNAWGLHDMHGNVWEWCQDAWSPSHAGANGDGSARRGGDASLRVLKGGAWSSPSALSLRSAARFKQQTNVRSNSIGFRVARSL